MYMNKKKWKKYYINKFLIVFILFIIWMLFFDEKDIISNWRLSKQLANIRMKNLYLENMIQADTKEMRDIQKNDSGYLELLARKKYFMKKEGEDIFIFSDSTNSFVNK